MMLCNGFLEIEQLLGAVGRPGFAAAARSEASKQASTYLGEERGVPRARGKQRTRFS